jgi:hypothetical protein
MWLARQVAESSSPAQVTSLASRTLRIGTRWTSGACSRSLQAIHPPTGDVVTRIPRARPELTRPRIDRTLRSETP